MLYKNKEGEIINVSFPKRQGKFIIPEFLGDYQCKRIQQEEFTSWNELTEVVIPESVTSIGCFAFCSCNNLTSVNIPSSVTSIEDWAFRRCNSLTNINIPASVTNIENLVFKDCINLTITINNSKDKVVVGKDAFEGCKLVKWLKSSEIKHSYFEYIYHRGTEPIWKVGDKLAYYEFCTDHEGVYDLGTITNIELDKDVDDWVYTFDDSNREFEEYLLKAEAYQCKK